MDFFIVIALVGTALAVRIPIAAERKIMPAGDVFNLQHIAENIIHGAYPHKENRLPGYPLLLLLTRPLPVDPVAAGVGVSIVVSALTMGCLYLTGRTLQIKHPPLVAFLGLAMFDPILNVSSIRPLSDATFIFWLSVVVLLITRQVAQTSPPTKRNLLIIGAAITAMIFTRYEGLMVAAFAFPALWIRLPWQKLLLAALVPTAAVLLWIPVYLSIHGSFTGGYIAELNKPSNNFAVLSDVPSKLIALLRGGGWGNAWTIPAGELEEENPDKAIARAVQLPHWWTSILAVCGVAWLLASQRTHSLPLVLALLGYIAVLIWWVVYGRFVAPLVPFYYLTAAAGGSFLIIATSQVLAATMKIGMKNVGLIVIALFFGWILWSQGLDFHRQSLARAWENNQRGYALFQAIRQTAALDELTATAYWNAGHAIATLYFKQGGFYFNLYPDDTPNELYRRLQEQNVRHIIMTGDDTRLPEVKTLLSQQGNIQDTTIHRSAIWSDNTFEEIPVLHLQW